MTGKYHLKIKWEDSEKTEAFEIVLHDNGQPLAEFKNIEDARLVRNILNKQEKTIQDLIQYKYLVKALEEVSGSHYIEEIISDYTDGAVSDEKEQLELGKWHSEHGLSWEDGDME